VQHVIINYPQQITIGTLVANNLAGKADSTMTLTMHAIRRKQTRGIADEAIKLAQMEGKTLDHNPNRILLTRKMMWEAVRRNVLTADKARMLEKSVQLVVVVFDTRVVTVLRPTHRINATTRGHRRAERAKRFAHSRT
jgi:hypothetical protein